MQRINLGHVRDGDLMPTGFLDVLKEVRGHYGTTGCYISGNYKTNEIIIGIDTQIRLDEYIKRPVLFVPCVYKSVILRVTRQTIEDFRR